MSQAPVLYQETRLSPSIVSSQTLHINTAPSQQQPPFGAGRKRAFDEISGLDEDSYARKCLATEGSIFFRRKNRAPRSILWRVLEDRKVLEIQSVDLIHPDKESKGEGRLAFRIQLPDEILRDGVAFADPEENDALEAFVLTTSNELYTITLKRDLLTRECAPSEFDASSCFEKYAVNGRLYRIVAVSSLELLISLHDGSIVRLERQPNESGRQWRDTFFGEGGWQGTLRGLISLKKHQMVRYGNSELDPSTVAAMAKTPDGKSIWTASLDHELRLWNVKTGKKTMHMDIHGARVESEGKKQQKYIMSAEQGTLLQLVTLPTPPNDRSVARMDDGDTYYLVVHSPKDHQFKFYEAKKTFSSIEGEGVRIEDLQPRQVLIPPIAELMNTNIWHLEDFFVKPGVEWQDTRIWLRARSGALCRTFTLSFDLLDENDMPADLEISWQSGWTVVDSDSQTMEALRASNDFPGDLESISDTASTPTERWLDFVFYPGRFSFASIETALHVYRKGRGLPASTSSKGINAPEAPLKERLAQAVTSKVMLRRLANELPDYEGYQRDIQAQWKTYFSLLSHLHTRRHDSIGLAFDSEDALAWSVCADYVAPIRAASNFDKLSLNSHILSDDKIEKVDENVTKELFPDADGGSFYNGKFLATAKFFASFLSPTFRQRFADTVRVQTQSHEPGDHDANQKQVQQLCDDFDFDAEVLNDEFEALENMAEDLGGLGNINEDLILELLERMDADVAPGGKDEKRALSQYGSRLTIAVAQESLHKDREILINVLTLVVFMYAGLEEAELHVDFVERIGDIYGALIARIKNNELLSWLAKNEIATSATTKRHSTSSQTADAQPTTVSLLERLFIGDWETRSKGAQTTAERLTIWSKAWTYGGNLHNDWNGITAYIMSFLIRKQCHELATEFQKFISQSEDAPSWLRYLEGRLLLATGDYALASLKFQAAAEGMAESTDIDDSASLLSPEEKNYFGRKLTPYYQHVSALFEKLRVFSYTADFAGLALENLEGGVDYTAAMHELDKRKGMADSPEIRRVDDSLQEISLLRHGNTRDEIRSRLFEALSQIGRFAQAFDALVGIGEEPLQKKALQSLIDKCVKQGAVPDLLELPFEEGHLAQEADGILLSLAKKGLASGSSTGPPYYQILYAFRTQRSNFRGAAEILYEYLERLKHNLQSNGGRLQDPEDDTLVEAYVLLINTLACCGEEDAWLLADPIEGVHGPGMKKRRLVTLADVRRAYGIELDRKSYVMQGRFPLVGGGEEMDVL